MEQIHLLFFLKKKVKKDKVSEYLELADKTDKAVEAAEPGMLHHTFDFLSGIPIRVNKASGPKNKDPNNHIRPLYSLLFARTIVNSAFEM